MGLDGLVLAGPATDSRQRRQGNPLPQINQRESPVPPFGLAGVRCPQLAKRAVRAADGDWLAKASTSVVGQFDCGSQGARGKPDRRAAVTYR